MGYLEIIAVVFYFISVLLVGRENIWAWPTAIVGVSAYFLLFVQGGIFAQAGVQVIFLLQSIYGWWNWIYGKTGDSKLKPTWMSIKQRIYAVLGIVTTSGVLYLLLSGVSSYPILDASSASLSLVANWLTTKKKMESWYLWMFTNLVLITIFALTGMYLSIGIYIIFMYLDVVGIRNWKKELIVND